MRGLCGAGLITQLLAIPLSSGELIHLEKKNGEGREGCHPSKYGILSVWGRKGSECKKKRHTNTNSVRMHALSHLLHSNRIKVARFSNQSN